MEQLKHECGVAMVRLLKPLEYYQEKYGSWMYGLNKLYLLMEKQHNRGQEGAGLACVKLESNPGEEYMFRDKALGTSAITEIFSSVHDNFKGIPVSQLQDAAYAKRNLPYAGELLMGHLRYSTTGRKGLEYVHPFLRRNNWRAKNLALCGNFNLTNVETIFKEITSIGQHPRRYSDTYIMLEQMGHRLDREVERLYKKYDDQGLRGMEITHAIEDHVDLANVLRKCAPQWDGGYVISGLTGSGETFAVRDPWGLRPAFYYYDDEVMILASERPVIQTAMNLTTDDVKELKPGQAIIVTKNGDIRVEQVVEPRNYAACSFERIYFSRGSDQDIYKERKKLGANLVPRILKAINNDIDHSVFSFIPNTAEVAFFGMEEGLNNHLNNLKKECLVNLNNILHEEELERILSMRIRTEKVVIKDIKLRTFISEGDNRNDLAAHVYDITYGSIEPYTDNLVVIDDSIVRGTTLKQSIIRILDRLHPKKLVIVSSSPQIRYPDYYGIDMARLNEFIAFRAAIALLKERNLTAILTDAYEKAKVFEAHPEKPSENVVKAIYEPFTDQDISKKMAEILTTEETETTVEIVYQSIKGLHDACPNNPGDWYFSGNYPTPGGVRRVNQAYINYIENEYLSK